MAHIDSFNRRINSNEPRVASSKWRTDVSIAALDIIRMAEAQVTVKEERASRFVKPKRLATRKVTSLW